MSTTNYVNILDMPVIKRIIERAELQLLKESGSNIGLKPFMRMSGGFINQLRFELQNIICDHFETTWAEVCGNSRKSNIKNARHVYMYLCRVEFKDTFLKAASGVNRDHTSCICAVKKINGYYEVGDDLCQSIEIIKEKFNALKTTNERKN